MISSESLVCMDLAHAIFVRKTHFYLLNLTTRISIFCILYRNCTQTSDEGEGSAFISHFWSYALFQNWGDKSIRSAEYCIFATFLWDSSLYNFTREKTQECPGVLWSDISAIAGLSDSQWWPRPQLVMECHQAAAAHLANYWWPHHRWFCSGRWLRYTLCFRNPVGIN